MSKKYNTGRRRVGRSGALAAVVLCVSMLTGCGSEPANPSDAVAELQGGFSCVADIQYDGFAARATLGQKEPGVCEVTFSEPAALKGMTLSFDREQITVGYLGMQVSLDNESVLANSAVSAIVNAIDAASRQQGISVEKKGSSIVVTGQIEQGTYEIVLDAKTGAIGKLSVPGLNLEAKFT